MSATCLDVIAGDRVPIVNITAFNLGLNCIYVFSLCAAFLRYDYIIIDYGTQIVHVIAFSLGLNYTQDLQCL